MKLITYTMQYLTSILSLGTSDKNQERMNDLEKRVHDLEANVNDLAFCIQQLAATATSLAAHISKQPSDHLDSYLDDIKKDDDDGSGYLH